MTNNTLLTQWYTHHLQALMIGLGDLLRKPFASLMTLMVIGVAMALPSGLYILLSNLQDINQHWNNKPSLSLYLVKGAPDYQITAMLTDLKRNKNIASVKYVSPKEGLETFKQVTQFKDVLADLNQNPLPGVIVVTPVRSQQSPTRLQKLLSQLQQYPQVKIGQLDMAWVKRLYFIITIGERITYSLALLFGIGVVLIIGNTIRLTIQRHHEEMRILKLVGATDAFIRRPMLYRGVLYGFFGGIVAWVLVALMLWWLKSPAQSLAQSYNHNLVLSGLTFFSGLAILFSTAGLGLLGAWLAGHRQLRALDS